MPCAVHAPVAVVGTVAMSPSSELYGGRPQLGRRQQQMTLFPRRGWRQGRHVVDRPGRRGPRPPPAAGQLSGRRRRCHGLRLHQAGCRYGGNNAMARFRACSCRLGRNNWQYMSSGMRRRRPPLSVHTRSQTNTGVIGTTRLLDCARAQLVLNVTVLPTCLPWPRIPR
jgi:hypothetical protein